MLSNPFKKMMSMITIGLVFMFSSCSTYNPNIGAPAPSGNKSGYYVYIGKNDITNVILQVEYLYKTKNYQKILKIVDDEQTLGYLDSLYLENIYNHIVTFDQVDFDHAIEKNAFLYSNIQEKIYTKQSQVDFEVTKRGYIKSSDLLTFSVLVVPFLVATTPLLAIADSENTGKAYGELSKMYTKGYSDEGTVILPRSQFIKTLVDINCKKIKQQSAMRLSYLYDMINEIEESARWKQLALDLK